MRHEQVCLVHRVSPVSRLGPGIQQARSLTENEWRKQAASHITSGLPSGAEVKGDGTGHGGRRGCGHRRGVRRRLWEGTVSWKERNCGLSGTRQRCLWGDSAGCRISEMLSLLAERGRPMPLHRAGSRPGAAQRGHCAADTGPLNAEPDPLQLGETHLKFTSAAAPFCLN